MPSHTSLDGSPALTPWGGVRPSGHALPAHSLDALGRLAATLPAASPAELAQAWVARAAECLSVRALHLALREGAETRYWSAPHDAPLGADWREVEEAIDAGAPRAIALGDAERPALVRIVAPIAGDSRPIGALVADAPPQAVAEVLGALEALRWPLALRLTSLLDAPPTGQRTRCAAMHALCEAMHRCDTLTDLLSRLLEALPGLVGTRWAAVAACDPTGRVLYVTSLDTPDPLGPEGWANAARATGSGAVDAAAPLRLPDATSRSEPTWIVPMCADSNPLRYLLAVGGSVGAPGVIDLRLLGEAAAHAETGLARIVSEGELRLARDAHARVARIAQVVTSLNHGESPDEMLSAVMGAVLCESPGLIAGALHLWTGERLVREQSVGDVPPPLCRGAGRDWWRERLDEAMASRQPGCWLLPEGCGRGMMLVAVPIPTGADGGVDHMLGVASLFTASLEAVDLSLGVLLSPYTHIIAQLARNLQHYRALERANSELERHKAQIIESKGALEAILDGFPDGLFIVDRDLRVALSNDVQALRVQGAEPANGQYCWELFGSGAGVCAGCRVMDTLKKGISTRRRMRVRRPEQPEREWEVATHPIARRSAQSAQAALVVVRDVTEQEQIAKSLAQVEKLAAVGRLAAGIAHEINNPLAAIQANVQLLLSGRPDDEQVESLEIMRRATERARRVVRNLLSFSEQSLGYLAPVDVNATIRSALDLVSHQAGQGGVTIECHLAEGLPPVMASREQLESVWLNLAVNALDAVLEGGVAGHVEVTSEAAPHAWVRVSFRDNGPGIPGSQLPHVFEPFGSSTSPTVGTGLGLFSCHNVVKRHGGSIRAGTGESGGSRFEVLLPALDEDAEGTPGVDDDAVAATDAA